MLVAGRHRAIAAVKLCLDPRGVVTALAVVKKAGLPGWERLLCERIRTWRYAPYTVDGAPVSVCTALTFIYQQDAGQPPAPPPAP